MTMRLRLSEIILLPLEVLAIRQTQKMCVERMVRTCYHGAPILVKESVVGIRDGLSAVFHRTTVSTSIHVPIATVGTGMNAIVDD